MTPAHFKERGRPVKALVAMALALVASALVAWTFPATASVADASAPAKAPLTLVTSFYPIYIGTLNVAGGVKGVKVANMTGPQTGCLHDYQFTPADLKKLEGATAFIVNGAGMEAFMGKVVARLPKLKVVDASKGIPLIKDANGEANPHVWVSISNAILQVRNIAGQLAKLAPAHSKQFAANADAYVKKLEAQRAKMHVALDGMKGRDIVTFHEAFPYFAKEFGLNIIAVVEREPGSEPSAAELAETIDIVKESGCKALFTEPQYPVKAAQTIARETGAAVYTLDPAVSGPMDADAYLRIMASNLVILKRALKR